MAFVVPEAVGLKVKVVEKDKAAQPTVALYCDRMDLMPQGTFVSDTVQTENTEVKHRRTKALV